MASGRINRNVPTEWWVVGGSTRKVCNVFGTLGADRVSPNYQG